MTSAVNSKRFHQILNQVPADYYDRGIKTNFFQKYWHTRKWRALKKFLNGHSGKLLDIGCADGATTYFIHQLFPNLAITGIDYYKKAIDYANRSKSGIKFLVADAHKLPFKNGSYDLVTSIEVLEHLHSPKDAIEEIYRVLKPLGYLIIGQDTDSLLFRSVWWFWTKWKGTVWEGSHINCARPEKILRMLRQKGFSIKQIQYLNLKMEIFIKCQKK